MSLFGHCENWMQEMTTALFRLSSGQSSCALPRPFISALGRSRPFISPKRRRDRIHAPFAASVLLSPNGPLSFALPVLALPVVALAASAGGIQALITILSGLPAGFQPPVLIAQHVAPEHPSELVSILSRHTTLTVRYARQGERIPPGHVYVPPSGRRLEICPDQTLSLPAAVMLGLGRPSADRLFLSLAQSAGERAVAAVLSGIGSDGSQGIREINAVGGRTIAQDEESSLFPEMPRSAVDTGCIDFVLPLTKLPKLESIPHQRK